MAGDERVKAFDLATGKLKHTLSCRGGYDQGAFGVHGGRVFRANASGTFACWDRGALQTHAPSMDKVKLKISLFRIVCLLKFRPPFPGL